MRSPVAETPGRRNGPIKLTNTFDTKGRLVTMRWNWEVLGVAISLPTKTPRGVEAPGALAGC